MANTTTTSLSADLQTYFAKKLLVVAEPVMVFKQFGNQEPIPANSSKTISFTQYAKLGITTPQTPLSEGVAPATTALAPTAITASISQYGAVVEITDLAELTVKHPVIEEALYLLGRQAGETIDTLIQNVVLAGTSVVYPGAVSSRSALGASNVMTTTVLRTALKVLEWNAAVPFGADSAGDVNSGAYPGQGKFVLVVDPSVKADLTTDTTFVTAASYSAVTKLFNNEIGEWFGVRVVESNLLTEIASTTTVHTSLLLGRNAYAVSDLQTLTTYIEGPGSVADPLHQVRTLGWKVSFATVILNNNFMVRIETGSAYN